MSASELGDLLLDLPALRDTFWCNLLALDGFVALRILLLLLSWIPL